MIKSFKLLILFNFFLILGISCDKNSLQLPFNQTEVFSITCKLNGIDEIEVIVKRGSETNADKLELEIKNLTGIDKTNLKLLIECFNNKKKGYANVFKRTILNIDTLKFNEIKKLSIPYNTELLTKELFDVVILSTSKTSQLISGSYNGYYVQFENSNYKPLGNPKYVNGYILADGNCLFRIADDLSNNYTIYGRFMDTTSIRNGWIINDINAIQIPISLDTIYTPNTHFIVTNDKIEFRLKLQSMTSDSTHTIKFNLIQD